MNILCQAIFRGNRGRIWLAHRIHIALSNMPTAKAPPHKHVPAKAGIRKPSAMRPIAKADGTYRLLVKRESTMLDKYRALNQIQRNRFIFLNHHEKYTLAT